MKKLQPNKMKTANILSIITYWWMNDFFKDGRKRNLQEDDMLELLNADTSYEQCSRLERNWEKELGNENRKPNLFRTLLRTHKWSLVKNGLAAYSEEVLRMGTAVLVSYLVRYFEQKDTLPMWHAYAYAVAIVVAAYTLGIVHHQVFYRTYRIGWHMRISVCALMYKKTLRLSQKSLSEFSSGKIINLGATDVIRYDFFPPFMHFIWIGPLQCVVGTTILWWEFGPSILAGMGLLVVLMALQSVCGKQYAKLRLVIASLTDKRVLGMNEVITGMRIIKMYAWEKPFAMILSERRRKEIDKILVSAVIKTVNMTLFVVQEKMITLITITCYIFLGGSISAFKVFYLIGVLSALRLPAGMALLQSIEKTSEAFSSSKRIQEYLLTDEFCSNSTKTEAVPASDAFVEMKSLSAKWNSSEDLNENSDLTLNDISLRVNPGELLAVIGPVGAGKSSLLSALLGELPALSGEVAANGDVAYAGQIPWVFSGTVRENILFGGSFDRERYAKVISACCLTKDLDLLEHGDMTLVGERGVTLSGGQKARVNLARAAYKEDCNIYLLDDPLSAVDAPVARHLYTSCISGGLLKNKIRILITHQLQLLKTADRILILKEGKVAGLGTYEELRALHTDFASLLRSDSKEKGQKPEVPPKQRLKRQDTNRSSNRSTISTISYGDNLNEEQAVEVVPEEERRQGSIGSNVYMEYLRVGAIAPIYISFLLLFLASHSLMILVDWWLSLWSNQYRDYSTALDEPILNGTTTAIYFTTTMTATEEHFDTLYYWKIYIALCLSTVLAVFLRLILNSYICVSSGIQMHFKMFHAILHAPIRFFDTNPSGRILNRFSKDMGQVDELLPLTFMDFLYIGGHTIAVVILVAVINYFSLIMIVPVVLFFIWLRRYYIKTSRDIKRLEGACRSPVFSLLSSTLQGLITIRGFRVEKDFVRNFHETQDLHSASWFLFLTGSRWFGIRLDFIGATFLSAVTILSVIASSFLDINAGLLGLLLTQTAASVAIFQWGVRQSTEVENLMTSVERIQQYYKLPPEAPHNIPEKQPHKDWPTHGALEFRNVSFSYYDGGPVVLKDINLSIEPKEKIGLVGRTGAGKSSIISAVFRLAELADGSIRLDGIDVGTIGLHDLRSSISIIPQDPVLFTGSLRRNLDLFGLYSDADIFNALEQVQLYEFVMSLPDKLQTEMAEAGSNFSVGQRQLICLARALLRKNKLLLIDEATANVDLRTDRLIQVTIREKFTDCTVITIAHRINTIIDSDRIIVLEAGAVKEFDEPHMLLQKKNGTFSAMVDTMGFTESAAIRHSAEMVHLSRRNKALEDRDGET